MSSRTQNHMRKSANDVEKQIEPIIAVKAYKPIAKHSIAHTHTHIYRAQYSSTNELAIQTKSQWLGFRSCTVVHSGSTFFFTLAFASLIYYFTFRIFCLTFSFVQRAKHSYCYVLYFALLHSLSFCACVRLFPSFYFKQITYIMELKWFYFKRNFHYFSNVVQIALVYGRM